MPTTEEAREFAVNDIRFWYGHICGWALKPPDRAWVDLRPKSSYMRCIQFFR